MAAMASADLRKLLDCSVCLNIFSDPVNLKCGHNFCRVCIDRVLDTQAASGGYLCPECRDESPQRPELHKSLTLRNLVEDFLSSQPDEVPPVVLCTYCVDSATAAVRSCLLCEASLCENHLRVHSKTPEHVLSPLTATPQRRKCPIHRRPLEYYCTEEAVCICASCKQDVQHSGHQVQTVDEAAKNKKANLNYILQRLRAKRDDTRKRVQSLQARRRDIQEKAGGVTKRVHVLSGDIRRKLEDLEKKALTDIPQRLERDLHSVSDLIQKLEVMMDDLFRKMRHFEELSNTADPLTILLDSETGDLCDPEERGDEGRARGDIDLTTILHTLQLLSDITPGVTSGVLLAEPVQIFLDENTASNSLEISADKKMASYSTAKQNRPQTSQRFSSHSQVLSTQGFFSGRHHWDVDVWGSDRWQVGVCYNSMDRGRSGEIGWNNQSWGLQRIGGNRYLVAHNKKQIELPDVIFIHKVRVCLDYEAGRVSFYHLSHPIRLLHTFTATFSEPLHAVLAVTDASGCVKL